MSRCNPEHSVVCFKHQAANATIIYCCALVLKYQLLTLLIFICHKDVFTHYLDELLTSLCSSYRSHPQPLKAVNSLSK